MFKLAAAELRYNLYSVLAWLSVLLVSSWWTLVEAGGLNGVPGALAMMLLGLSLVTPICCFVLLNVERNERRQRLWRMLPAAPAEVAGARLLRAAMLPLFAAMLGSVLILLAALFSGMDVFDRLAGSWVLAFLLVAGFGTGALVTLLYDLLGMASAQVVSALLVAAVFVLNAFVPAFSGFVAQISSLAQTPTGVVLIAVLCLLLVVADVQTVRLKRF